MPGTESSMLALGTPTPDFALPDVVSGRVVSLKDFADEKVLLVMFICPHCPYVVRVQDEIALLARDFLGQSVGIVGISSNDAAAYPSDSPEGMRKQAIEVGFSFPYLYDESQAVARAFGAACTPEFYVFDQARKLVYRGQLDESRRHTAIPVTGRDLRVAMRKTLAGLAVDAEQVPSMGCSIKWKSGS